MPIFFKPSVLVGVGKMVLGLFNLFIGVINACWNIILPAIINNSGNPEIIIHDFLSSTSLNRFALLFPKKEFECIQANQIKSQKGTVLRDIYKNDK